MNDPGANPGYDAFGTSASAEPSAAGEPLTKTPARLIVCGGRNFTDYERVVAVMDRLRAIRPIAMVFHGNARGADTLAARWCRERGVPVHAVSAQWSKHGRRAGPLRNQAMLGHSIDLVVAFPGGAGTEDMCRRARKAGVLVTRARATSTLRPQDAPQPSACEAAQAASLGPGTTQTTAALRPCAGDAQRKSEGGGA